MLLALWLFHLLYMCDISDLIMIRLGLFQNFERIIKITNVVIIVRYISNVYEFQLKRMGSRSSTPSSISHRIIVMIYPLSAPPPPMTYDCLYENNSTFDWLKGSVPIDQITLYLWLQYCYYLKVRQSNIPIIWGYTHQTIYYAAQLGFHSLTHLTLIIRYMLVLFFC